MSFYRSTRMNGSLPPLLSPSMCSVSVFPLPMLQIDWERRRIVLCDLIDLSAKPVRLVDQFATSIVAIVPLAIAAGAPSQDGVRASSRAPSKVEEISVTTRRRTVRNSMFVWPWLRHLRSCSGRARALKVSCMPGWGWCWLRSSILD
eukprot:COSAG03_NODE_529_length_7125_cov_25.402220_3_plen_147_part_00